MTAVTSGSAEMLALADKIGESLARTRTYSMREWAIIENAIRLAAKPDEEGMQASSLVDAWRRYVDLFGEPPHGTEKQMHALLRLIPPSRCPPLSTTGEPKRTREGVCTACGGHGVVRVPVAGGPHMSIAERETHDNEADE